MPDRVLPERPDLDHLEHEAKALLRAYQRGDDDAIARVRAALGGTPALQLTDAQRAVAREYGFVTWARLRAHVQSARGFEQAVTAFLNAVQEQDAARARQVLDTRPRIASESVHVAATCGRPDDVARLVAENPASINARLGRAGLDALLCACFSPFHGENSATDAALLETTRDCCSTPARTPRTANRCITRPSGFTRMRSSCCWRPART